VISTNLFSATRATCAIGVFAAVLALNAVDASAAKRRAGHAASPAAQQPRLIARPTPFSSGPLAATAPPGWAVQTLPKVEHQTFYDLVNDGGTIVLRARANGSASSLRHGMFVDPKQTPVMRWRWRTQRMLQGADLTDSDRDDQVARIYVYFERSEDAMTLKERARFKLGRARHGKQQLSAALCYVWDNRHPVDSIHESAETPFVALVVAANGDTPLGKWVSFKRDVTEDYRRAFNTDPKRIIGVAVSVDTDGTGETATTWFGDIDFVPATQR
jgi:hypothetical protein